MNETSVHVPAPRRQNTGFTLTPLSTSTLEQNRAATPTSHALSRTSSIQEATTNTPTETENRPPHKSRSILNLTASTLFGIYSPTGYDPSPGGSTRGETSTLNTPWGTGAQTPRDGSRDSPVTAERLRERAEELSGLNNLARTQSLENSLHTGEKDKAQLQPQSLQQNRRRRATHSRSISNPSNPLQRRSALRTALRSTLLFFIGICYGGIVTQLHGSRVLPATVEFRNIDRTSWTYLAFWGACGIVLGNLLPWVDRVWARRQSGARITDTKSTEEGNTDRPSSSSSSGLDWNPIVRSIGAFIGIAFAIRRLPWQSTLQLSLTLALANPVIWYLLDRTRNGFLLSAAVALAGSSALISINPGMLPSPIMSPQSLSYVKSLGNTSERGNGSARVVAGSEEQFSYESLAVATWTASVLFCSCVCFGNIGRRLLVDGESREPRAGTASPAGLGGKTSANGKLAAGL